MKDWNQAQLRKFRKELGMTQKEFAEVLGVSRTYIGYLEIGKRLPNRILKRLLDCLEEKPVKEKDHDKRNL